MRGPGPSCWMSSYIDVAAARNSSKFSVKTPWNYSIMYQRHARPLVLYPDTKFELVVPHCDHRGSEHFIAYWNYACCNPLEEFHREFKVPTMPRQEIL